MFHISSSSDAFDRHAHRGGLAWRWWEFVGCLRFALPFITVAAVDQLLSTTAVRPAVEAAVNDSNSLCFGSAVSIPRAGHNVAGDNLIITL
mmetsp:Transcript_51900/g.108431  ORF Transcript_51900/g.108431 Transcript_51900/m.108431 type:complete len:91 (-) Transcript_51900:415-687(-)